MLSFSLCMLCPNPLLCNNKLTIPSTTDDNALRNKVNEAMNVYNEYVKTREQPEGQQDGADGVGENAKPEENKE